MSKYIFGNTNIQIESTSETFAYLKEEFSIIEGSFNSPDLKVIECEVLPVRTGFVKAGQYKAGENFIYSTHSYFNYLFEKEDGCFVVYIQLKPKNLKRRYLPNVVGEFLEMSNLTFKQLIIKSIIYDCLDFIIQQVLIQKGQTFVHASAVKKQADTLAFLAWGGVGKTTALLKLMNNKKFSFLSDDLAIIDKNGDIFRNPKKMQVYAYNMEGEPWLEELVLKGRTFKDKLFWDLRLKLFGKNKVRRRVFPEQLFGDIESPKKATLTKAIYLERTDDTQFSLTQINKSELALKAAYVLTEELKPFSSISSYYKSTFPQGELILGVDEMVVATSSLIEQWLKNSTTSLVLSIPEGSSPTELFNYLESNFL